MTPPGIRPWTARLAIRFAFILAVALLPAGVIAVVQTNALEKEIKARSEVVLIGATIQAAAEETALISRVLGMVGSVAAAMPYVLDDPVACDALTRRAAALEPSIALVAFLPLDGMMTCSSSELEQDFSDYPLFKTVIAQRVPYFIVNPKSPVTGTSVLSITHPVLDLKGNYIGYVGMSLPHATLRELAFLSFSERSGFDTPVIYWTFDKSGQLLTSNRDRAEALQRIPLQMPLSSFVGTKGTVFEARSVDGRIATYSVAPIVEGDLYLMSSFVRDAPGIVEGHGLSPYLPTFLMWLAGLVASGLAADLLVTRHVRTLNRSIVNFALGDRRLETIELRNAPVELEELATAYMAMTESVMRSEADLEDSIHQKEVLLREVHHRVKNNLQLISSIMNIQLRSARGGEARDLLKNLQERIMSLATVHRGLYLTSGLADVRARELIPDIVRQIMAISSGPERPFETRTEIDDLRLVPDQAVPLSLLLAEALTNALKHSGARRGEPAKLSVRLKRSGGNDAVLEVTNSHAPDDAAPHAPPGTGIGVQLIGAFVQQLGGVQEVVVTESEYTMRVTFGVASLSAAENRRAPVPEEDLKWNETVT